MILGGVGVVETTMAALYGALGVPAPIAVVVLIYRLLSLWLPTFAGVALVFCFEHPKAARIDLKVSRKAVIICLESERAAVDKIAHTRSVVPRENRVLKVTTGVP